MARLRGMKQIHRARWQRAITERATYERPASVIISPDEPYVPQITSVSRDFARTRVLFRTQQATYIEV